jgi:hypothetical protein
MAPPTADSLLARWFRPTLGPDGVAAAERHAREMFARFEKWGASAAPKIEWQSVATAPRPPATFGAAFELASDAALEAVEQEGLTRETLAPDDQRLPYFVDRVLRMSAAWQLAVKRDLEVLPATWPPSAVRGHKFSELPDPFEPILQIWQLGYLIEADDESAKLLAPIATLV